MGLFEDYVKKKNSPLQYLLTYEFSQDHIELFFCCVRPKNGWNNNPTAYEFYSTYKRLALRHDIKAVNGNCISDETSILTTASSNMKEIEAEITTDEISIIKEYNLDVSDMTVIIDGSTEYVFAYSYYVKCKCCDIYIWFCSEKN
ncbi:uncharacterized protein [Leptinotarsa decemlineata]|uniref:uncharacterized protein n=1 Tax=Leptinotarsa decemlineata TaxID=7539 RepID=UPI003D30A9B3